MFSDIPEDVMETLLILVEIELSRRERAAPGSVPVEREMRSPAQIKITGTMKRARRRKCLTRWDEGAMIRC